MMKKLENLKPVITCVFVVRIGIEVPKLATNMGAYDKFRVFFATRRLLRFFAWKTRHTSYDGFSRGFAFSTAKGRAS